jgi:3-deoxy-D-manno-octulosonic-acid transferase
VKLLYNLFISLYPFAARLISGKNEKAKLWVEGRKDIFARLKEAFTDNKSRVLWVHCSSLGEFEQGRPVIEELKKNNPSIKILLTFFSPSGYEVRKNYEQADWVFYLPMDSADNATKFFDIVDPSLILFVKYEFWHYYLAQAKLRNIPLLLVSGVFRNNQPFFKWYGELYRNMLGSFTWFFVQNEESVELLNSIGIEKNVTLSGDTRFDRVLTIAKQFGPILAIENFIGNGKQVIVAGSTWLEDDEILYHYTVTHPNVKFIVAPHDIQKSRIEECLKLYKKSITFSDFVENQSKESNILIIDNIGMLSRLYKYATICFVGGAFGEDGVHNVLEAAVYHKPVVFGPEYSKYFEAGDLIAAKGAYSIESTLELEKVINTLFDDAFLYNEVASNAGNYVIGNAGATNIIAKYIYENRLLTN